MCGALEPKVSILFSLPDPLQALEFFYNVTPFPTTLSSDSVLLGELKRGGLDINNANLGRSSSCADLSFHYLVLRWCYRRTWRDFVATGPARREVLILQYRRDLWGYFSPQWVGVLPLSL